MHVEMQAVLLESRPKSGEFDEVLVGSGDQYSTVKFRTSSHCEYCGVFAGGFGVKSRVCVLNGFAFVISYGQGYIFDIEQKNCILETKKSNFLDVVKWEAQKLFIACTPFEILVYGDGGLIWSSPRVSADGVELNSVENGIATGRVYDFEKWVEFKLMLTDFQFHCSWAYPFED